MQHAEVFRSLVVLAHGVGDPGAGVHAAQRGADQRQEDGEGFGQHEVVSVAVTQQRVADDDHHIADGSSRGRCALHRVARVEKVVGRKVFDQIADQSLNDQRTDDRDGDMLGGVLGLTAHRGDGLKAHQDQNGDRGLNEDKVQLVRRDH